MLISQKPSSQRGHIVMMLGGRNLATTGPSRIVSASLLLFVAIVTFNTQACSACSCPYVTIKEQLCFSDWLAVVTVDVQVEELQLLAKTIADIEVGAVNEVLIIPLSNSSHSNNVNSCDLGPDDFIDGGTYVLAGKEENGTLSINMCYYHILWTDVDEADRQMFLDWNDSDYNEMCKDHCPPGCLEYFDGCNTCGCTFEGDLFDCSTAVCDEEQTVDPLCTCSATEPSSQCELECTAGFTTDLRGCAQCECIPDNNLAEQFCPVNCEVYSDGCYTCVCDRDGFNPICDTTECVETGQPECLCEYAHSKCEPEDRICAVYLRDEKGCETCACELYLDSVDTSKGDLMTVEGVCPDDCEMYFDGCNFCICGDFAGCTLKKCTPYETTDPFCIDDYADNEPSTPLYITPDDNDLVNCPIYLCTISCLYGYQQTDNGCNACACKPKPDCPELDCPACDTSLMVDDTGCSTCDCFVQKCPEGCNQYSDGCNTFLCLEDQGMEKQTNITCVREEYHAAACLEGAEIAIPENCRRWFDGCNQCMVDLDGTVITCSTRQCTVLRDAQCVMYYHDDDEISTNSAGNPRVDGDIVEMNDSAFVGVGRYPSVGKEEAITPSVDD